MVLPGIHALFGFQLVAVFHSSFTERLTSAQQVVHLAAPGLSALSAALMMTPAAYHRQAEKHTVSRRLIDLSSRLLTVGMFPLLAVICLDFYVIAFMVLHRRGLSAFLAALLAVVFAWLWYGFPRLYVRKGAS